jgi:hypothetical protein
MAQRRRWMLLLSFPLAMMHVWQAPAAAREVTDAKRVYSTRFSASENPISEGGIWINGGTVGLDWTNVSTAPGHARGEAMSVEYADPTALVSGKWAPDQAAEGRVYTVNQNDSLNQEVELRLRSTISPHSLTGYEVFWKCSQTAESYYSVVRWNGPLGDFTVLLNVSGVGKGVKNGDVIRATIVGDVITLYKNGAFVDRVTDATYASGAPGIGFYLHPGRGGSRTNYGFTSFRAEELGPPRMTR